MGLFDSIKNMLGAKGANLPENLDSQEELTNKVKEVITENTDKLDQITDKIPGTADDNLVDSVKQKLQ